MSFPLFCIIIHSSIISLFLSLKDKHPLCLQASEQLDYADLMDIDTFPTTNIPQHRPLSVVSQASSRSPNLRRRVRCVTILLVSSSLLCLKTRLLILLQRNIMFHAHALACMCRTRRRMTLMFRVTFPLNKTKKDPCEPYDPCEEA